MTADLQQLSLLAAHDVDSYAAEEIRIRASRRARRLTLKVVPPYRIELVVPLGTPPRDVAAFVSQSREWICRTRADLDKRYPKSMRCLPGRIELAAVGASYEVDVRVYPRGEAALRVRDKRLTLAVTHEFDRRGFELLRQWLLAQGRQFLKPQLFAEAEAIGVAPKGVQVRTQRTRWGSCSENGAISLNAALLLLRPPLVRYLVIHELCHLVHLNHSTRYWRLVERFDPNFRAHDRELSSAWAKIPVWALPPSRMPLG